MKYLFSAFFYTLVCCVCAVWAYVKPYKNRIPTKYIMYYSYLCHIDVFMRTTMHTIYYYRMWMG